VIFLIEAGWIQMAMETEALPIGLDLTGMAPEDLAALRKAVRSLEHPGLAARLTNMIGKPVELIGNALPASASQVIAVIRHAILTP
jgi:hypothetical protein